MIAAFRGTDKGHQLFGEEIGFREVGKPSSFRWKTLGAVFMEFAMLAGKGRSDYSFYVDADSFEELAGAMFSANKDAAIRALGAVLQTDEDPTIKACGEILSDQRK